MPGGLFKDDDNELLRRPRISARLRDAVKNPLTVVCAGAGFGKTRAVYDFTRETAIPVTWMQLSERDNAGSRFWAKYVKLTAQWNKPLAERCKSLGFPDTADKLNRYHALCERFAPERHRLFVLDDVHLIDHPDILLFLERRIRETLKSEPAKISVILICRELPAMELADLHLRGAFPTLHEDEFSFTEDELARYFSGQGLLVPQQTQREILKDTGGWAFSVNLVARSLKKAPGYAGYVRLALKRNIFGLMQKEAFDTASPSLRQFLIRLSLIDHLSADLVGTLAGNDEKLLSELKRQNAYIRFDGGIHAYHIHRLFLDFLRSRQNTLSPEAVSETYRAAADWCRDNGFEIDALLYLEKNGDYEAIVAVLSALPVQMPVDLALCASGIFERAPAGLADNIYYYAVMHVRVFIRLGRLEESVALAQKYEARLLGLPADNPFRNRTLGVLYYSMGNIRALMSASGDRYDFDACYAKMYECLAKAPVSPDQYSCVPVGFWVSLCGSSRSGAPQEYIEAAARSAGYISHCWGGSMAGADTLCRAELMFYQGGLRESELVLADVLRQAQENRQFELENKSLFFLLRVALLQGDHLKAEQALRQIEAMQNEESYAHRFLNCDAAHGWYACFLRRPEDVPSWLRESFASYGHAYFIENLGNQIKARYCYLTGNFPPLLAYIEGMKRRESILYGRVELLALEACARLKMKEKDGALATLREAYEAAFPNDILTPFVELGKDMRTLSAAALREPGRGLPAEWLETVNRKSASCAKYQSQMIANREKALGLSRNMKLSARENDILSDLYRGLSRSEIAARQNLSINTVNSVASHIFNKLGANNIADIVRIAAEEKLVR